MIHPDFIHRLAICPIRGLVTAAIQQLRTPTRVGYRATETTVKVKAGVADPVATLSRVIVDEHLAGAKTERLRAIPRALDLGIRRLCGVLPNYLDLSALMRRETEAQCKADLRQLYAMRPDDMPDADIEQLIADLYTHSETSAELATGLEVYLLNRAETRAIGRGRLAA